MRGLAIAYSALLAVDGVLSIIDRAALVQQHHFSTWTTVALCTISIPMFVVALVLTTALKWRPRWPLLVSTGAYSTLLVIILFVVICGVLVQGPGNLGAPVMSDTTRRLASLLAGSIQVCLGAACIIGATRSHREAQALQGTA
jgi:hypothetical protein